MTNIVLETIKNRRTIRGYKQDGLSNEQIETLIDNVLTSPTAFNKQDWHFTFVTNYGTILKLEEYVVSEMIRTGDDTMKAHLAARGNKTIYNAPLLVIISANRENPYSKLDSGIAAFNLSITAKGMGLDSVMLGSCGFIFGGEKAAYHRELLKIPETHDFMVGVAVGYKDAEPKEKEPVDKSKISVVF
jgi:nitroreductase